MSLNVKRQLPLLEFLRVAPPKIVKLILENSDDQLILALCEICSNLCRGNIPCHPKQYNKLKKYRLYMHKLARAKKNQKNLKQERAVLYQKGGAFLPLLLAPVLSGLTQYFLQKAIR